MLGLLKDKGTLQEKQIWAGRNSDKSKVNLQVRAHGDSLGQGEGNVCGGNRGEGASATRVRSTCR